MRKEFLVERQGKQFVLYAGLLALAHEQGLSSITTDLVQIPSEANNRVAICTARVTLDKDGVARRFHGIGDAAPNNVAPGMVNCLIRLAETRAKARALRDAVNVGTVALEEMNEEDVPEPRRTRTTATANKLPINNSGAQCPKCYALNGSAHLKTCATLKAAAN